MNNGPANSEANSNGFEEQEASIANTIRDKFELLEGGLSVEKAAEWLAKHIQEEPVDGTKVVAIVGGPGGGKSTLVNKLIDELDKLDLKADSLGTDDYVLGTRAWRWEREREDPLKLKDFDLLNRHIESIKGLKDGETVKTPTYDQETGLAIEVGEANFSHEVGKVDVLIVEGDFDPVRNPTLRVFIDVPANARMQARIDRDLMQRGEVDAQKVADSFKSRHEKQFIPHTAPAIEHSDIVLQATVSQDAWQFDVYKASAQNTASST